MTPDAISQTHLDDDDLIVCGLQGNHKRPSTFCFQLPSFALQPCLACAPQSPESRGCGARLLSTCFLQAAKFQARRRFPELADKNSGERGREQSAAGKEPTGKILGAQLFHRRTRNYRTPTVSGARPRSSAREQAIHSCVRKKAAALVRATAIGATSLWVEGYTTEEVSVMLNVTPAAVRTRLFRARKTIAAALRPSGIVDRVT